MKTQFKDQKNIKQQRVGLQVISTIQKMLAAAFILIGILSISLLQADNKVGKIGKRVTTDKIFTCKSVPKGIETTTVTLYLQQFSLPRNWPDPGNYYEITTGIRTYVYLNEKSKEFIWSEGVNWGEKKYLIPNVSYDWNNFHLAYKLIVHNVPFNGKVGFFVSATESDSGANFNDYLVFNKNGDSGVYIEAYPSKEIAYTVSRRDGHLEQLINFGKSKRLVGLTTKNSSQVIARLDFTITQNKEIKVGGAVRRDKVGFCRKYASTAVNLIYKLQKFHCRGLFLWNNDYKGHYDWCIRGHNDNFAVKENIKRENELKKCMENKTDTDYCHIYAQSAVDQFQRSQKPGCTVSGPGWSPDENAHFQWCVNTFQAGNMSIIDGERTRRETMLSNCK